MPNNFKVKNVPMVHLVHFCTSTKQVMFYLT